MHCEKLSNAAEWWNHTIYILQSSLSRFAGTFQCEWVLLCSCAIFPYSYYYLHAFLVVSLWINNVEVSDKTKISFRVLLDLTLYILVFRVGQNVPTFVQVPHNHYSCLCASTKVVTTVPHLSRRNSTDVTSTFAGSFAMIHCAWVLLCPCAIFTSLMIVNVEVYSKLTSGRREIWRTKFGTNPNF